MLDSSQASFQEIFPPELSVLRLEIVPLPLRDSSTASERSPLSDFLFYIFILQISPLDDPGQFWWVMTFQTLASGCLVPDPSQTSQKKSCLPVHALRDMFWFCNLKQIAQTWRTMEADDWSFALCKCGLFCLFRLSWDISPSSHLTRFLRNSLESWIAVFSKFIWTNSLPRSLLLLPSSILVDLHKAFFIPNYSLLFLNQGPNLQGLYYYYCYF